MTLIHEVPGRHGCVPAPAARNPLLFLVGCEGSGDVLVLQLLAGHSALTMVDDSVFFPGAIENEPFGYDPPFTRPLLEATQNHSGFSRLGLQDKTVWRAAAESDRYTEFVARLYDEVARMRGKRLTGERLPGYCRNLPQLHALFPDAKVVHVIRDGRDVALSMRPWSSTGAGAALAEREPIAAAALWWRRDIRLGRGDGGMLPRGQYHEVRYEALVAEPQRELRRLTQFLGLPLSGLRAKAGEGMSLDRAALGEVSEWKTRLSDRECELFEAIAGYELGLLGYERRFPRISAKLSDRARECERWWAQAVS